MPTIITTDEISDLLGGVSKQRVSNIVRDYDIPYYSGYDADVFAAEYFWPRMRMEIAREFGETVSGHVSHDEWDVDGNCPECGAFAVHRPPTLEEYEAGEIHGPEWKCVRGHSGKSST